MNPKKAAATIGIKADSKALDADLASAKKKLRGFAGVVDKINGGKKMGKVWGGAKGAVVNAVGGATAMASSAFVDAAVSVIDFERNLTRLQIAAGKSTADMDKIRASIYEVSRATGISTAAVLEGTQTYVDLTGDVDGATAAMSAFARISQASGASVSDVATATAALKESMQLDPKDIEAAFSGLIMQGKAGAVSLKDFAGELSRLAPQFAAFGGSGLKGIADLGASLQVIRKGFGSADQAAVGMQNLMTSLTMNAKKFSAAGVKIFKVGKGGKKEFRGWLDIIDQIDHSKLANSPDLLAQAFGSSEASRAFNMLRANRGELEKIYEVGLDVNAVERDRATFMASNAGRIEIAMNNMKLAIAEAMTPERIEAFVNGLERAAKFAGGIADSIGSFMENVSGKAGETDNPYYYENAPAMGPMRDKFAQGKRSDMKYAATLYGPKSEAGQKFAEAEQYNDASSKISRAGSRSEQIKAAIAAKAGNYEGLVPGITGSGSGGTAAAGQDWMKRLTPSADEERKARAALEQDRQNQMKAAVDAMGNKIVDAMKNGITVKIDGGAVQQKLDSAPAQRSGRK